MEVGKLNGSTNDPHEILDFLRSFRDELLDRIGSLENRVATLGDHCRRLEDRARGCRCCARHCDPPDETPSDFRADFNGKSSDLGLGKDGAPYFIHNGSVLLSSLNAHSDYPQGSWLGDDSDPRRRVRVPIDPKVLLNANSTCRSPEKMALKLLDLLFDRDTQANANISGSSKYGKEKLNPVFIYGILCHLVHIFKITSLDWERIKLSIDSKCRSALRRKRKILEIKESSDQPPSNCLDVCTANSHLAVASCGVSQVATNGQTLNESGLGSDGTTPCLDGPKDNKRTYSEPSHVADEDSKTQDEVMVQLQNKPDRTPPLAQHEPGSHSGTVASTGAGGVVPVSVEEGCPSLLRADSFEFNDLLSGGEGDPDRPEEPEVVGDVISLDAAVVSDEMMSSVSECGGYLEVLQVSPETMLTLQQTHRVQMQPDGTLIAMPLITPLISAQTSHDNGTIADGGSSNDTETMEGHKRALLTTPSNSH